MEGQSKSFRIGSHHHYGKLKAMDEWKSGRSMSSANHHHKLIILGARICKHSIFGHHYHHYIHRNGQEAALVTRNPPYLDLCCQSHGWKVSQGCSGRCPRGKSLTKYLQRRVRSRVRYRMALTRLQSLARLLPEDQIVMLGNLEMVVLSCLSGGLAEVVSQLLRAQCLFERSSALIKQRMVVASSLCCSSPCLNDWLAGRWNPPGYTSGFLGAQDARLSDA
jgi:hypothetical protein